jgi:CheY-like chemotaxis protein
MTGPLALLVYEKLLPGSQLLHKLKDLGYRVLPVPDPADLASTAEREKPLVVFVDLEPRFDKTSGAITELRGNAATNHVPVIAFSSARNEVAQEKARVAGATLVVQDTTVLAHLGQFLEQALRVD